MVDLWLLLSPLQINGCYVCNLSKVLDSLNYNFEKFQLIGNFNSEDHDTEISRFINNHEAKNIVKEKSVVNSSCVDLLITNSPKSFQHTHIYPCELPDHYNLVFLALKYTFGKQKSNVRYYRDWRKLDNAVFRTELREALKRVEGHDYKYFEQTFLSLLNLHALMKSKKQRANHRSYITKTLRKVIMKPSELASKYHKIKQPNITTITRNKESFDLSYIKKREGNSITI